jgi:divalent metal cation (Fe/Co/Zn/Cd) transporter
MSERSFNFEYITIIYNLIEAYISIVFGLVASSIGLLAFGIDSLAEAGLGLIIIMQVNMISGGYKDEAVRRSRTSRRLGVVFFFILGSFLLFEPIRRIIFHIQPKPTLGGLIIALVSLFITPIFAVIRYKTSSDVTTLAQNIQSALIYMSLPLMLLIGLGLNYFFGYWQADLLLAVIIAVFLFIRGYQLNLNSAG